MNAKKVAIIGAGPSGLTSARQAILTGFEPTIFEKRNEIGGRWAFSADATVISHLPSTRMQSPKQISVFSELPASDQSSVFLDQTEALDYLNQYSKVFKLDNLVRFGCEVIGIRRVAQTAEWTVEFDRLECIERRPGFRNGTKSCEVFGQVLICTGRNQYPFRPNQWRNENKFKGQILHSSQYKDSNEFRSKRVVIVGFGDSAVEIANDLAAVAKEVAVCVRHGEWPIFRSNPDSSPNHEVWHSRASALMRKAVPQLLWNRVWESEAKARLDLTRYGVERPKFGFWNTIPTFADGLEHGLDSGCVKIVPDFLSFEESDVEFADRTVLKEVDAVIICTGYTFMFPFLEEGKLIRVRLNDTQLYLHMFHPELSEANLACIGFANVQGPRWPISELQARLFFQVQLGKVRLPSGDEMLERTEWKRCQMQVGYLKTQRHTAVEDYVDFATTLSSLIGAEWPWTYVLTDPMLAIKCMVTPLQPAQFRLTASDKWAESRDVILANYNVPQAAIITFFVATAVLIAILIEFVCPS